MHLQISTLIDTMEKQLTEKGQEINRYMEEHKIQVRGGPKKEETAEVSSNKKATSSGVLVQPTKKESEAT